MGEREVVFVEGMRTAFVKWVVRSKILPPKSWAASALKG